MSSKACFSHEREDLIRAQQKLLKYFDGSADKILQFSQFQTLVNVVKDKAANFKQEIIESNKRKLISLAGKIGSDIITEKSSEDEALTRLEDRLKKIRSEVCYTRLSNAGRSIKDNTNNVISSTYSRLKSDIFSLIDKKPDDIDKEANVIQQRILRGLSDKITEIVKKELKEIQDTANRKIKDLDGVKLKPFTFDNYISGGNEIGFSGAFENMDLNFEDILNLVNRTAAGAAVGGTIGSIFGPVGTLVGLGLGAVGGGIAGAIKSDDGKANAKKAVSDAISKATQKTMSNTAEALTPIIKNINQQNLTLKKSIKNELENIEELKQSLENFGDTLSIYVQNLNTEQYGRI